MPLGTRGGAKAREDGLASEQHWHTGEIVVDDENAAVGVGNAAALHGDQVVTGGPGEGVPVPVDRCARPAVAAAAVATGPADVVWCANRPFMITY